MMRLMAFTAAVTIAGGSMWYVQNLPPSLTVIDGDTVETSDGDRWRLVGFDAPELFHPRCANEYVKAVQARDELTVLLSGDFSWEPVACSCRPGAKRCNYNRKCVVVRVDNRNAGEIMIAKGLAVPYHYDWQNPPTRHDWCQRLETER